jgi:hypothetical protein
VSRTMMRMPAKADQKPSRVDNSTFVFSAFAQNDGVVLSNCEHLTPALMLTSNTSHPLEELNLRMRNVDECVENDVEDKWWHADMFQGRTSRA